MDKAFYPHLETEKTALNALKTSQSAKAKADEGESLAINRPSLLWLSDKQIKVLDDFLKTRRSKIHRVLFHISILTGLKFSVLHKLRWSNFSGAKKQLIIGDRTVQLSDDLADQLFALRDKAGCETEKIFKVGYKPSWRVLRSAFDRAGLYSECIFKALRYSYMRKHFYHFRNKKQLAESLGLKSLRRVPAEVFKLPDFKLLPVVG